MRFYNYLNENVEHTKEMEDYFNTRTNDHIKRVQKNLRFIGDKLNLNKNEVENRAINHDASKFSKEEREPYIWLSWYYKKKNNGENFQYPDGMEDKVREASKHHIETNAHHPESHYGRAKSMSDMDIAEMVADHAAMSQEMGDSLVDWTNNNTMKKYKWTDGQRNMIWKYVNLFPELR